MTPVFIPTLGRLPEILAGQARGVKDQRKGSKAMSEKPQYATELEYLRWFRLNVDFGPASGEVKMAMDEEFESQMGKLVPIGWRRDDEE